MPRITFLDTEIQPKTGKILDIGCINESGNILHTSSVSELTAFLRETEYICGHNIIEHDLKYLNKSIGDDFGNQFKFIDTLFLSPLLFPKNPYHHLLKDDKLQTEELNNPLNDAKKAKDLFYDELDAFEKLDNKFKRLYRYLLGDSDHYDGFFKFLQYDESVQDIQQLVFELFAHLVCINADLLTIVQNDPVALAYTLALIDCDHRNSITPPWVLHTFPAVERIMFLLRSNPCLPGCRYCNKSFDAYIGLKSYFDFDSFRKFDSEPLQENAVNAALNNKSILVVFPTGGGKSLAFQVPALMAGDNAHALTVVISPLQSLMKDQVDNLEKKGITDAVTINGLLDPIERAKAIERIEDGRTSILYISPEALRSKTIEKLLLGRKIARFVIDEAHCFSSWGHDFRVDYLYIGEFIRNLQTKKNLIESIPISCFTATAKPQVIDDIKSYFLEKLNKDLDLFRTETSRKNLHYKVIKCENDHEKYDRLRDLVDSNNCPTIVYVSRTKRAETVAKKLSEDGYLAKAFHGKMDVREKTSNQNAFMEGEIDIMVATSAFGMGVDKENVGMVVHYEISGSLENYIQEAGRAGRDESISAECYILFNEDDLGKHFILLNQTKIDKNQIQEVWKAIKNLTKFRTNMSNSALEIARKAGWNEQVDDLENRVTTAIAALEDAGYVKRTHNSPRIFATSILAKNADEAILKINNSSNFNEKQKQNSIRIIKKLISSKSRTQINDEVAESRIDYISDHLGISQKDVIRALSLMREEKILADTKDLSAYLKQDEPKNNSINILQTYAKIEQSILENIQEEGRVYHIKEINESAQNSGLNSNPNKIHTLINFWAIKNWIKRKKNKGSNDHLWINLKIDKQELEKQIEKRHSLSGFIIDYLYKKVNIEVRKYTTETASTLVEFSVHELKEEYEKAEVLFKFKISIYDVEESLFYLSRIDSLNIEGGFLVVYNRLNIDRIEQNIRKQYKDEDYESLKTHYDHKIQQIHIVGEYAKKMVADYMGALTFVDDYFQLNFSSFLNKYFPGSRKDEIVRSITPAKFKQLFGELSPRQLDIIKDKDSQYIQVAAGPGSGKTKLLVHKLASIIYMEDVKHEQLLMLTFSRAAVTEFKTRLIDLIGNAALFIEIMTFHSYCFDLLGRVGSIEKSHEVIKEALGKLKNNEVEPGRIAKVVLVIDEAQDMDEDEFELVKTLMDRNPEMRIIAVGDDDQNIYEFRKSDSKYFQNFANLNNSKKYELIENYRSKQNLVEFTNQFVSSIENRIKSTNINAVQKSNGQIRLIKYYSNELITPLVDSIVKDELSGSTCILTRTNDEALYITGMLNEHDVRAKLIQSNTGFNLLNIQEIRYLLDCLNSDSDSKIISDESLIKSKKDLKDKFKNSYALPVIQKLIKNFEQTHPKSKYKSDLELYIGESKLEDFVDEGNDTILVSTIHKAKGKEFDNVFMLLNHYDCSKDSGKRQLYVGMTRAKNNLTIHYNSTYLDQINVDNLEKVHNNHQFEPPKQISIQLSHRDLNLGYFEYVQRRIIKLYSGDQLGINGEGCVNDKGEQVLKFSHKFIEKIERLRNQGYLVTLTRIDYLIFWFNAEKEEESLIILPELTLKKDA